jgi:hypothetical protein
VPNANADIYSSNNSPTQQWKLIDDGNGYYQLEPQVEPGKRLDVSGAGTTNGTNVAVWHENGTDAQKWKLIAVGGGYYELEPKHAPGQRLDVAGAGTGDNNNVALYQQNGNDAQKWRFTLKNSSVPVAGSVYELSPKHATGLRLHETGIVPTADAVTVTADNSTRQQWKLINDGGGYYQLEPQSDVGKRLDVSGAGTTQGTNVAVWHQNGLDAQKWKLIAVGGGYYELEPKHAPGQRLDVAGAGTASPTNVYLWTQNGNDAQKWKFIFKSGARLAVEKSALMGDQLLAYPNPSSGKVTVTYQPNQHGRVSLHLYSSKGELVRRVFEGQAMAGKQQQYAVDASTLPPGLYLLKLLTPAGTQHQKLVLNK